MWGGLADVHATHENFPGPPFTFAIKNTKAMDILYSYKSSMSTSWLLRLEEIS